MVQLQPDKDNPGHYINPDWTPGTAGTFAVIIGVSEYKYFDGTPAFYGMDSLGVSALSAYRFFEWLCDRYQKADCPLAECWLLLSPTEAEKKVCPELERLGIPPDWAACDQSIRHWNKLMSNLPKQAAELSQAMFFFSGHGLEVFHDKQILLPSDYDPNDNVDRAINTNDLSKGLGSLDVPSQFLFIDACRNNNQKLKDLDIQGTRSINIESSSNTNPNITAIIFYSTASGQRAYQQRNPAKGISMFGQALVDGLVGTPPLRIESIGTSSAVNVYPLQKYMKQRVTDLLEAAIKSTSKVKRESDETISQRVLLGGRVDDAVVTEVTPPEVPVGRTPKGGVGPASASSGGRASVDTGFREQAKEYKIEVSSFSRRPLPLELQRSLEFEPVLREIGLKARLYSLSDRTWRDLDDGMIQQVEPQVNLQDTFGGGSITLQLPPDRRGYWVEWRTGDVQYACVLPADEYRKRNEISDHEYDMPTYVVDLDIDISNPSQPSSSWRSQAQITQLEARLSTDNRYPLSWIAEAWDIYTLVTAADAAEKLDLDMLEIRLFEKGRSPLTAAIAATILLRSNRTHLLHDWLRNLSNWFPAQPDGPVLWSEQLLQQRAPQSDSPQNPIEHLLRLQDRGLPYIGEVLGYAAQQTETLLEFSHPTDPQKEALTRLNSQIRIALRYFRNTGLFCVFSGELGAFSPELILPES